MPRKLPKLKTPTELREEAEKKLTFSDKWEEELKKQLFEEKEEIDTSKGEEYLLSNTVVHKKRPGEEWDVPISEKIEYFDPELSYELTGYRPITMDQGLDFDPTPFREMAILYERTGCYTKYPKGRKLYNDLWDREYDRCKNGLTIGKYRITGDHYFFLNYYRMQVIIEDAIGGAGRQESFPGFLSKQYEFFHYVEMAERLHKDVCILKARGIGLSEIVASLSVRPYTTNKGYKVLLTCPTEAKLTPLKNKCWFNLDWLNTHTSGGMRHARLAVNNQDTKRASLKTPDGTEFGWMSEINSVVADTSDKIRGDRIDRLIYEECFDPDTLVIMSDYTRKKISDIKIGDFVMGVDGSPQEVIHTTSGIDTMYEVSQNKGETYVVNSKHKLYVERRPRIGNLKDEIVEMTCPEYNTLSPYYKRTTYGLKSPGLQFNGKFSEIIDPYFLGLWLGDGDSGSVEIVVNKTKDPEIENFILKYFNKFIDKCKIYKSLNSTTKYGKSKDTLYNYRLSGLKNGPNTNFVLNEFKRFNLINNKHIPKEVFFLPIKDRLKVLAGLIDTDGNLKKGSSSYSFSYEIAMSRKTLIDEIAELARSCGFYVKQNSRMLHKSYKDGSESYRVIISGDLSRIPVLVKRKRRPSDYSETSNKLSTGIRIKEIGVGKYSGITLKSYGKKFDNLFLLNDYTIVHNCGSNSNLTSSWIKGDALVSLGGKHFGVRVALGTGGDDMAVGGLSKMFSNPHGYNILPFKNYDTDDGKPEITAFFIPAHKFALTSEYLDSRGVTDHIKFRKYYEKQRSLLKEKDYLDECAEHCFTPREALSKHGDNIFDANLLAERLVQIKTQGNYIKPKRMQLLWDPNVGDGMTKVTAHESPNSKLLVVEPPMLDETGNPYSNLYVAGIDAIDMGKRDSASDSDVSDFCIVIKKRVFGMDDPKYVAIYKDRPNDIRKAYDLTMKLLTWYNCKAMLEYTKISIQTYFREKGKDNLFMKRPAFAISSKKKGNKSLVGLPATEAVINHGLELVNNFVNDYWFTIDFEEIINQLINYSYADKRKFDIVAALQMVEVADEDMSGVTPTTVKSVKSTWQDFGWYTDEYGRKRRGVIPNSNKKWP